jgi:hypothetical protein
MVQQQTRRRYVPPPVPELDVQGVLYYREADGTRRRMEEASEQGGRRSYRLTLPGEYEVMLADRMVVIACWKGVMEMVDVVWMVAGQQRPLAGQAPSHVSLRAALVDGA